MEELIQTRQLRARDDLRQFYRTILRAITILERVIVDAVTNSHQVEIIFAIPGLAVENFTKILIHFIGKSLGLQFASLAIS